MILIYEHNAGAKSTKRFIWNQGYSIRKHLNEHRNTRNYSTANLPIWVNNPTKNSTFPRHQEFAMF